MTDKNTPTTQEHKQFNIASKKDNYNQDYVEKASRGSERVSRIQEISEIHSTNFKIVAGVIVSGWRLTRRGLETVATGVFPPGSITFSDIQNIATSKILGRVTAGSGSIEQLSASQVKTLLAIVAGDISGFDESVEDVIGGILADSTTIDFTYDDAGNSITAVIIPAYRRKSLFDHYTDVGNVGTGEDDLFSDTIAAAQLANNGEKLEAYYSGTILGSAVPTRQIRAYFGGTLIYDSTAVAFASNTDWNLKIEIIRVSSSVVRCTAVMETSGLSLVYTPTKYTEVTSLTLANTQVLKITGEAAGVGAATNDIVAKLSAVEWKAAG